uniref:Uncharacterized protein n=1 Tax=Pseudenhygromyxa salsuginis TaxID=442868 RepID=A0A3S7UWN6_9BACT|nr:hypothetical protein [Pseudenhygromyxa salsuginis]
MSPSQLRRARGTEPAPDPGDPRNIMLALFSSLWLACAGPELDTPIRIIPEPARTEPSSVYGPLPAPEFEELAEEEPGADPGLAAALDASQGQPGTLPDLDPVHPDPEPSFDGGLAQTGMTSEPTPALPPPLTTSDRRRKNKNKNLVIGGAAVYGLGAGITWATAAGTGILGDRRPGGESGLVLGMTLGGMALLEGSILAGIGLAKLGKDHHSQRGDRPDDRRRSRSMRAGGATLATLGAASMLGTTLLWPTIRQQCPIGVGCGLAGLELGSAAVAMGAGMIGYGKAFRPYEDRPPSLSKKAQTPLIAGTTLLSIGYLNASMIGMYTWQANRDDPQARRTRDRLLIPVVGPWIHAAGPDANWAMAILTGGLGALQIAGAIALGVGAGLSARERRSYRRRSEVALVPSFQGVAVVGRF